jgi:hypothetical protein
MRFYPSKSWVAFELMSLDWLRLEFGLVSVKRTIGDCPWDYSAKHYPIKTLNGWLSVIYGWLPKTFRTIKSFPSKVSKPRDGWTRENLVLSWLKSFLGQLWELVLRGLGVTWCCPSFKPFGPILEVGPGGGSKLEGCVLWKVPSHFMFLWGSMCFLFMTNFVDGKCWACLGLASNFVTRFWDMSSFKYCMNNYCIGVY